MGEIPGVVVSGQIGSLLFEKGVMGGYGTSFWEKRTGR